MSLKQTCVPRDDIFLITVDESIDINSDLATEQAEKMGRIDVTIDRMQSKKLKRPKKSSTGRAHNPLASTAYAKDIVKDKHIRHAMMLVG